MAEFREALATYTGQGNKGHVPLHQGLFAELEADGHDTEAALTRMDAALALAGETGEHWTDSFLDRIRGEIVLKRDPENSAPAEEAFLTAVAVAAPPQPQSIYFSSLDGARETKGQEPSCPRRVKPSPSRLPDLNKISADVLR
jgi:hypothetical protein